MADPPVAERASSGPRAMGDRAVDPAAVGPVERLAIGHAYERALFAGQWDDVRRMFTDDITYWVAGRPPIGGEWRGPDAVINAFANREFGLGAADWGYEVLSRTWSAAGDDRVVVEIRERSWLVSDPADVMDQRTCCVIRFRGDRIASLTDYTDSHVYEQFVARHRASLPKFAGTDSGR
jgi:ketosteroid isomerase-like protein